VKSDFCSSKFNMSRRLLTDEQRDIIQRLEVTQDVLAALAVRSRKERGKASLKNQAERRAKEAKRKHGEAVALATRDCGDASCLQ
jgi:hypothetical protein